MPILPITAMVVNEVNCFLIVNDEDVGTSVVDHTDDVTAPLTVILPMAFSCENIEGVNEVLGANTCMVNFIASHIVSPSSNIGDGVDVVVDSNVNYVPLEPRAYEVVIPMGLLVFGIPVVSGDVGLGLDTPSVVVSNVEELVDMNVEVPLIDVPISLVSNDVLLAQLAFKSKENEVVQGD